MGGGGGAGVQVTLTRFERRITVSEAMKLASTTSIPSAEPVEVARATPSAPVTAVVSNP